MKHTASRFVLALVVFLAGCSAVKSYQAEKLSGDENQVSVKAGKYADPGEIATRHCQQYGKSAALAERGPDLSGIGVDRTRIYTFQCN